MQTLNNQATELTLHEILETKTINDHQWRAQKPLIQADP